MCISSGGKLKIEKSYLQSWDNFLQVIKSFVKWLVDEHEEVRKPEDIEPRALNRYIGLFLVNLKRVDGKDMEPDSLTSYHRAIDR